MDGPIFQQVKGWLVVIGDGDILPALEMASRFMEAGQTSRVWSHSKYAMGTGVRAHENTKVPPHSSVMYELTVVQKVMDTSRLNPYFTIQKALTKKTIANDIYQFEWCPPPNEPDDPDCASAMSRAIRLYQKSGKEMETLLNGTYFQQVEKDHPQRGQCQQILLDSLNNIVAVYMRQKEYHKAKQSAVEVLKQDPKNLKGLLRAAKSSLLDPASTFEEVKAALDAAESEITYNNPKEEKELKRLRADFKKNQNEYKKRTKAMFTGKLKTNTLWEDPRSKTDEKASGEGEKDVTTTEEASAQEAQTTRSSEEPAAATVEEDKSVEDAAFWKGQIFTVFVQIVIPMTMFFLYRFLTKADKIARGAMVMEDIMVGGDAVNYNLAEPETEETIDLDL
jgi:tetratricopeptide (TPR) repeat protein